MANQFIVISESERQALDEWREYCAFRGQTEREIEAEEETLP